MYMYVCYLTTLRRILHLIITVNCFRFRPLFDTHCQRAVEILQHFTHTTTPKIFKVSAEDPKHPHVAERLGVKISPLKSVTGTNRRPNIPQYCTISQIVTDLREFSINDKFGKQMLSQKCYRKTPPFFPDHSGIEQPSLWTQLLMCTGHH